MTLSRTFESCIQVRYVHPHDIKKWEPKYRNELYAAREELLKKHPKRRVVRHWSRCMGRKHRRFPPTAREESKFVLVYRVTLDKAVRDA